MYHDGHPDSDIDLKEGKITVDCMNRLKALKANSPFDRIFIFDPFWQKFFLEIV
jgi:hypothetical protein